MSDLPKHAPAIVKALDKLEAMLSRIVDENPEEEQFWPIFKDFSDDIETVTPSEDRAYFQGRIDCMLKNVGMIP
ncbi:MAG: hypothetical protein ABIR62_13405, partial [Dokdonella sp.]|uniref:hypothetical protein n=1 Tax=Dokdonella sp. TaxID=2291710 RepID=UPI0032631C95